MNNKKIQAAFFIPAILLSVLIIPACKRYVEPPPYFEQPGDTTKPAARKVLIIGIDGAVGSEYKIIQPTVLMGLKAHSKFTWDAVSDEVTTDAASWKTLMTGISYSRHQIKDSSFIYSQPPGGAQHTAPAIFPSFFSYILSSARSDLKTSVITPWQAMLTKLVPEVEDGVFATGDAGVKDSALIRIKNVKSDLVVVNFNSVAIAGKTSGFSAASAGYKDAVNKVDGYIGELMTALKSRPGYNKSEEWLVIITGTHGGDANGYGGSSEKETNVFTFYYNERLKQKEFIKGGAFAGVQFKGRDAAAVKAQVLNDGGLYDVGTGQQTVQIKIKGSSPGAYPHFFSKTEKFATNPGWTLFTSGATWALSVRSATTGERRIQATTLNVFDNQWHTLTFVFYDSASSRWVKRFTDNTRVLDVTATVNLGATYGTISSIAPLTIGWGSDPANGPVTFYSSDVRIFNTALTDDEVRNTLCLPDIKQHPKYNNLVGYWPSDDGFGGRMRNKAPGRSLDFSLTGPFQWSDVPELPCNIPPAPSSPDVTPLFIKGVDVVTTTFYWLRLAPMTSWGLEGSSWISQYETEFVQL